MTTSYPREVPSLDTLLFFKNIFSKISSPYMVFGEQRERACVFNGKVKKKRTRKGKGKGKGKRRKRMKRRERAW